MPLSERKLSWTICLCVTLSCISLSLTQFSIAQSNIFSPIPDDISVLHSLAVQTENNYQQDISALPSKFKKELKEVYKQRQDNIQEKFDQKEIYTSAAASEYLQKIVKEIIAGNPMLASENFNCLFSRSGIPNASYLGEKLILFNMGLFVRLENESQAAFVLGHEIAHCYLHHSENSISRYVSAINSEEVQQELRNIKKSQYNKRADLEKLLKGLTFNSRHHSRDHESQADSMAVELLHNTRFDITQSLTTLALLDSIDQDNFKMEDILRKSFDAPDYPFQKKWLKKEEGLLGGHAIIAADPLMADSLKTHPDCAARIRAIEPLVLKYTKTELQKFPVSENQFHALKKLFQYEIVAYAFNSGNYSRSLYYTLLLLEKNMADPYLVTHTGIILNSIYTNQKKHTLGKFVDLPSPGFSNSYNILLQFISNLYLEDYAMVSYQYLKKYQSSLQSYPTYLATYNNSVEISK